MGWLERWRSGRRGPPLAALLDVGFVAIDVETTGLNVGRDALVAFAAIPFIGGRPGPGYSTLVNPGRPIPPASTAIHGITDAMVAGAPDPDGLVARLDEILGGHIVAGHGLDFDLAILNKVRVARGLPRLRNDALDTQLLTAALRPRRLDLTLEQLAAQLGVDVVGRHTAAGDALTAGRLLVALLPFFERAGFRTVSELRWAQRRARLGF